MASPIQEYFTKATAFRAREDAAIEGITADVTGQAALILKLQNSPGTLSPEDQASLDQLQASNEATTTKLEALDAMTAPVPPVVV